MPHPRHDWNGKRYGDLPMTFVAYGRNLHSFPSHTLVTYRCDPDYGAPWDKCKLAHNESVWMVPLGYWD